MRSPGSGPHIRYPRFCHVNDRPVGTDRGAAPDPIVSVTNTSSSEFAVGEIDADAYEVAFVLSYATVSSDAAIAT
jgi:hypothetical protein